MTVGMVSGASSVSFPVIKLKRRWRWSRGVMEGETAAKMAKLNRSQQTTFLGENERERERRCEMKLATFPRFYRERR